VSATKAIADTKQDEVTELVALAQRAQKGDRSALPALREFLQDSLAVEGFGGNLARHAQNAIIGRFCGENLLIKEALLRKVELLRDEMAGPSPTPVEQLLVERVVTCWLHAYFLEYALANSDGLTSRVELLLQRSLDSAHRRYLSALKSHAQVRRLAVPVLQVNIARKQINVTVPSDARGGEGRVVEIGPHQGGERVGVRLVGSLAQ